MRCNLHQVPSQRWAGVWRAETRLRPASYSGLKQGSGFLHSAVKLSVNRRVASGAAGGCFLNLLCLHSEFFFFFFLPWQNQPLVSSGFETSAVLFQLTCFSPASVWKGCLWHFTLVPFEKTRQSPAALFGGKLTHEPDDPPSRFFFFFFLFFTGPCRNVLGVDGVTSLRLCELYWWVGALVILCGACQPDYADQR